LDSSGAVGPKISDVPNGTLETKLLFQQRIEWGVGGQNLELKTSSTFLGSTLGSWGGGEGHKNGGSLMKTKHIQMKKRKLNKTGDTNAVKNGNLTKRGTQMLFKLKLFFG
jgi:hypothetical protein